MDVQSLQFSPTRFAESLLIDADGGREFLGVTLDNWQRDDFAVINPALRKVVGQDVKAVQRVYLERPRGHSKTTDIAVMASWMLFASRRKLTGVACAADKEQAGLIRNAIDTLLRLNPWLGEILEVQANKIINKHTGSTLNILSSDAATSYGLLLDFAIVDELTHWERRDLWDSIFSAAAKRSHCLLLVIANAGFKESWQWQIREGVRNDPAWIFRRLDGPHASWITDERLAEQRRLLPPRVFERLWLNIWVEGAGDALDASDIQAAVTLGGPSGKEAGWTYVAGLDIGLTRDSSALVVVAKHIGKTDRRVTRPRPLPSAYAALSDLGYYDSPQPRIEYLHTPPSGRLKVVAVRLWTPHRKRVELEEIEQQIHALHAEYHLSRVTFDPWQAEYLAQRLTKQNIYTEPTPFVPSNLQEMATATLDAFRERQIDLFDHPELIADLRAMKVVEKSYGYRLQPGKSADGTAHGDAATALAIALHAARGIQTQSVFDGNRSLVLLAE